LSWRYLRFLTTSATQWGTYVLSREWLYDLHEYDVPLGNRGDVLLEQQDAPHPMTDYARFLHRNRVRRRLNNDVLQEFNRTLAGDVLFAFDAAPPTEPDALDNFTLRKVDSDVLPAFLAEHLKVIAADSDRWKEARNARPVHPAKEDFAEINRALLELVFPNIIRDRREVRRTILINYDQRHRLIWFAGGLLVAVALGWYVNPNKTGLHGYYRDRLAATYLPEDVENPNSTHPAETTPKLAKVRTSSQGLPYLLFNASTVSQSPWKIAEQLEVPFDSFLLSPIYIGNEELGYTETSKLGTHGPSLADAMAISGAAVNPAYFVHHIVSLLMNFMNFRTGQYLPNPAVSTEGHRRPSMIRDFFEGLRRAPEEKSHVLLTDGGYVENLGMEELLKRRCKLVIVCDAAHDPDHAFDDLSKVLRRVQATHGIRISDLAPSTTANPDGRPLHVPVNLAAPLPTGKEEVKERRELLRKLSENRASDFRHFFVARILYPECGVQNESGESEHPHQEGVLIYIKPSLTGDEGVRLFNFAKRSHDFPHDPTQDQAFSEAQFDAYRQLGFHSGADVCRDLNDPDLKPDDDDWLKSTLWGERKFDVNKLVEVLVPDALDSPVEGPNRQREGRQSDADADQRYILILDDPDADDFLKVFAARELGDLGEATESVVTALWNAARAQSPWYSEAAAFALESLGARVALHLTQIVASSDGAEDLYLYCDLLHRVLGSTHKCKDSSDEPLSLFAVASQLQFLVVNGNQTRIRREAVYALAQLIRAWGDWDDRHLNRDSSKLDPDLKDDLIDTIRAAKDDSSREVRSAAESVLQALETVELE